MECENASNQLKPQLLVDLVDALEQVPSTRLCIATDSAKSLDVAPSAAEALCD